MRKFNIGLVIGVILGVLISLGYLFFRGGDEDPELEQKKEEVVILKQTVDTLKTELDSLRARKPERIEVIKRLPPVEKIKYIEKKLDEVDSTRVDSISFLPSDSTQTLVSVEDLTRIGEALEERDILKEEVVVLDSIVLHQDSIIQLQDTIITEQGKKIKKQRRKFLGIGAGGGAVVAGLLILLL